MRRSNHPTDTAPPSPAEEAATGSLWHEALLSSPNAMRDISHLREELGITPHGVAMPPLPPEVADILAEGCDDPHCDKDAACPHCAPARAVSTATAPAPESAG